MLVTQKKQYALRAIYELARRKAEGPLKTAEIAAAQAIPVRFLEVIMGQLARAGLVDSKRGYTGGYELSCPPEQITVGRLFAVLDGDRAASECVSCISKSDCPFFGQCDFMPFWSKIQGAIDDIYDQTTIAALVSGAADQSDPQPTD